MQALESKENIRSVGEARSAIYFDNAATTALDPLVLEAMLPYMTQQFGNPSSLYSYGRQARMAVELSRKSVAKNLGTDPANIFFTGSGTESSNTAITGAVRDLGCKYIITSTIEHHAVGHTVEHLVRSGEARLIYVKLLDNGQVDTKDLGNRLEAIGEKALVTLMHANNEIGNILDLAEVGLLCQKYGALFHSDTVQTVGHLPMDLQNLPVDFITGSSHKFHGPKGVGLLYVRTGIAIQPLIHGGAQERNKRAGTENVCGIVGFAKALELATLHQSSDTAYVSGIKKYMIEQLSDIPGVSFNGDNDSSLYTVLSVNFPKNERSEQLLLNLDMNGICASGGSACTSGSGKASHVISALRSKGVTLRFSFSKHNTKEEVDAAVKTLKILL